MCVIIQRGEVKDEDHKHVNENEKWEEEQLSQGQLGRTGLGEMGPYNSTSIK